MNYMVTATIFILSIVVSFVTYFDPRLWHRLSIVRSHRINSVAGSLNQVTSKYWRGEQLRKVIISSDNNVKLKELTSTNKVVKVVDYGSFKLLIISQNNENSPTLDQLVQVDNDDQNILSLNDLVIDTTKPQNLTFDLSDSLRQTNITDAILWNMKPQAGMFLVQFIGPVKDEWLNDLRSVGVQLCIYVGNNSYVVQADNDSAERLIQLHKNQDYLQFVGDYEPAFRLRQTLREKIRQVEKSLSFFSVGKERAVEDQTVDIIVQIIDDGASDSLISQIQTLSSTQVKIDRTLNYYNIWCTVQVSRLPIVAGMNGVIAVEEQPQISTQDEMQARIIARRSGETLKPGYRAWLNAHEFPTSGSSDVVVNVVDDCPTLTNPAHPDIGKERVAFERNPANRSGNQTGHGYINAQIIGGNGNILGPDNYISGLGIAPFVKVGVTAIFDNNDEFYTSKIGSWDIAASKVTPTPRVSNNSWGSIINTYNAKYDLLAQKYDELAFVLGKNTDANKTLTYVFAAGNYADADNDGIAEGSTISSPANAKNVITVGASESLRKDPASFCETDNDADDINDIAFFSGRGHSRSKVNPNCVYNKDTNLKGVTKLVRIKPDLVAPGTRIMGGIPQGSTYLDNLFGCEKYYPGTDDSKLYTWVSGTSHAAPAVSGGAALLLHKYSKSNLSPVLIKAWLMNSAKRLNGVGTEDRCTERSDLTSNAQGMGRLDLNRTFDSIPRFFNDQETVLTRAKDTYTIEGKVAKDDYPLRVTLAWMDPPASTNADSHLVNDLDLEVIVDGKTYAGNLFKNDLSIDPDSIYAKDDPNGYVNGNRNGIRKIIRDSENNVESIYLNLPKDKKFIIRVRAIGLNADGVTGNNTKSSQQKQDFALLVYNGIATSGTSTLKVPLVSSLPLDIKKRSKFGSSTAHAAKSINGIRSFSLAKN